ncbi:FABP family protein [Leptospira sp. 201903071]|uniref:heme-binding beta-barrel domain-containing protein n=1 Tax=Leptospira ainazelensis TaxID=2810034 RepID=UPI00196693D8|nr:heme-binding beta-barrel domain-containing protein [Leptospira ainazelensis]MBM9498659.1 FABP family protein [Leptospira ainazelensis]
MSESIEIYGPLAYLIGKWEGDKGLDISPQRIGKGVKQYNETVIYEPIGTTTNAQSQVLTGLFYRQLVREKSNDTIIHDQTGYWMWEAKTGIVFHSFVIPRGTCVVAGGVYKEAAEPIRIEVNAKEGDPDWGIIQPPFMNSNAKTLEFKNTLVIRGEHLFYSQELKIQIYDRIFIHTDENSLTLRRS